LLVTQNVLEVEGAELDKDIQVAKAKIEEVGLSEEDLAWALEQ